MLEELLDVAHHRLAVHGLVEKHAVPIAELFLPIDLPLRHGMFLQQFMRLDDQQRRGGLEAHASFDPDDRIPHVRVAADGPRRGDLLEARDQGERVNSSAPSRCSGDG